MCRIVAFVGKVPPLRGSRNVWKQIAQGLRPGLCRSVAPLGLVCIFITNQLSVDIDDDPLLFFHFYICYIKKISHLISEVASLSFFHLREIILYESNYFYLFTKTFRNFAMASALAFRITKLLPYECRRHDTNRASICFVEFRFVEKVLPLWCSGNVWKQLTQGLRPGLCRSVAPLGLFGDYTPNQCQYVVLSGDFSCSLYKLHV